MIKVNNLAMGKVATFLPWASTIVLVLSSVLRLGWLFIFLVGIITTQLVEGFPVRGY